MKEIISSVQLLSHVQLFVTPWTAARQASLSFTISWSSLKLMSIESVMPSNHLNLSHRLLLLPSIIPSITAFSNESALHINGQSIRASASVLPVNTQGWFPLGLTGLISLHPRDCQESSPVPQFKSINSKSFIFLAHKNKTKSFGFSREKYLLR